MRRPALLLLLLAPALAEAGELELLQRWETADPGERIEIGRELERLDRARRFVAARCVLVPVGERDYPLAELFGRILEPALATPVEADAPDGDLGLAPIHKEAVRGLGALRGVLRPPAPVGPAMLNLLLGYARDTLDAWQLPARVRLHLFMQTIEIVGELEGRVKPDARTRWLVDHYILPPLLGMARRFEHDERVREAISKAASRLSLPSVLGARAQAKVASLARGNHVRELLEAAYRRGQLDDLGVGALARTLVAQAKDDDAALAGAAPLLLELLGDGRVSPALRGAMVDVVLERMAPVAPLRPAAAELLAAAYGERPATIEAFAERRRAGGGALARPEGGEIFRFLQVVLLRAKAEEPPRPVRVVRRDVHLHEPIHARNEAFVGTLVPPPEGAHADLLGPSPGLRGVPDSRLIRRGLELERIAIDTYGARAEEIELCVALPRDGSEPVPTEGARLEHVLDLIRSRLERTRDAAENAELADLLVRIGTPEARAMAVRFARGADDASSLLALLEKGDADVAAPLLERIGSLDDSERERAFAAILALSDDDLTGRVRALAGTATVAIAAPAGDALLKVGDVSGVRALLQHEDPYARLCGAGLTLRLTPLSGGLRIIPREKVELEEFAALAEAAFPKSMGGAWRRLGRWLPAALREPHKVTALRTDYKELPGGYGPAGFANEWAERVTKGADEKRWPLLVPYLLDPENPGWEIPAKPFAKLLDALETRAAEDPVRREWIDSWVVLAVVQSGLEYDAEFLALAQDRLRRVAGGTAPASARRRPGLYWPIWAAGPKK